MSPLSSFFTTSSLLSPSCHNCNLTTTSFSTITPILQPSPPPPFLSPLPSSPSSCHHSLPLPSTPPRPPLSPPPHLTIVAVSPLSFHYNHDHLLLLHHLTTTAMSQPYSPSSSIQLPLSPSVLSHHHHHEHLILPTTSIIKYLHVRYFM